MSVWKKYTIIREELKMGKICAKFVPRCSEKIRRHDSREMVKLINSDPTVLDALVTCDESWIYYYDQETEFPVEACWLSQTQEGQTEQILPQTFDDPFFDSTGMIYMHWVPTGQTVNKEYYNEVLKGVQEEIPSEMASTLQIGSVAFPPGQYTSPQLHPCHKLFNQDGHQNSSSASLQSRSCSLSSEAVVMRQQRR